MTFLGENLKKIRQEHKLTQVELANMLGISQKSYSHWETQKTEPTLENVVKLANIFNTTTDYFLGQTIYSKANLVRFLDDYDVSNIKNWTKEERDSFKFAILFEVISKNDMVGLFKLRDDLVTKNHLDEEEQEIMNTLFKEVFNYFNTD
ncbi:helix-turn-helix domain-containing protein [Streptococcus oralis]|uniref:helix-turn-helix domain-containing protein n=1 Tax=Streptococcus oralis TaxID=1303 RepID=UPI00280ACCB4|nr:helix-turn-helix domain-containing protein [uncultured Streptococcus sp.]